MNKYKPIRVLMIPGSDAVGQPNGVSRVIENYLKYGSRVGIEFVDNGSYDLSVAHAGMVGDECDVSVLHGLYFTGDYPAPAYEYGVNKKVVDSVRGAYAITVPSNWVKEIFLRDMHVVPFVVPHGIDSKDWEHELETEDYFLYNKNRDSVDVCNSIHVDKLASLMTGNRFVSTFSRAMLPNMRVIGVQEHDVMKPIIQKAAGYLSLTKETFGIGVLEAMASGVPVLGWRYGGNIDLVQHGVCGYLAEPGNYDDLANGMRYILNNRSILSHNAKVVASQWTWIKALEKLRIVLDYALEKKNESPTVSVVVPTYNYGSKIGPCLDSLSSQELKPDQVIVVDDGSLPDESRIAKLESEKHGFTYVYKNNGGVATARNLGASMSSSKYICFIDADDRIAPSYLKVCVDALEKDKSLFIAYTRLMTIFHDGSSKISQWPSEWNFDAQIKRQNQIPTCCVMRKDVIQRTGGYRQRFAPHGAGTEDADLWTRAGSMGMKAKLVTDDALFLYTAGTGNTSKKGYSEVDWLGWKGYIVDGNHPFASFAKPKRQSHDVFQYDEPMVSVIIPVGPGHEDNIVEALDSVEGQTYKNWEVIVVSDTNNDIDLSPWPYARLFKTPEPKSGPGVARNIGAKNARGKLIMFLDADDWLDITALDIMLTHFVLNKGIIYTDYFGIAHVEPGDISQFGNRVESYDAETKKAIMRHKSDSYDCAKAQRQPEYPLYHWCIVTSLIPKTWHDEIGGFDESMKSWEDVDYHWRMAQRGKCYSRIERPLVYYNFSTGHRRSIADPESHLDVAKSLLEYMAKKYEGKEMSPCKSCGGGSGGSGQTHWPPVNENQFQSQSVSRNADNDLILCTYNHPNRGDHRVVGPETGIDYGYRSGGDVFLVHIRDTNLMPNLFIRQGSIVSDSESIDAVLQEPEPPKPIELKAPDMIDGVPVVNTKKDFDINVIPGITPGIGKKLSDIGVDSFEKLFALNMEYLLTIDGISSARAKIIMGAISKTKESMNERV